MLLLYLDQNAFVSPKHVLAFHYFFWSPKYWSILLFRLREPIICVPATANQVTIKYHIG